MRTHDSQKFLESFYFQYGHASIADLGHTVLCFEGISELAATEIEEEPLWDGQAKSSRYQDFSRSGFHHAARVDGRMTPRPTSAPAKRCWLPTRKVQRAGLRIVCTERLPRPDDMKPDAYQRNLAARAFDVARYLLFWGVPTNVGQVTQHPHAGKADPPPEGVASMRNCASWATRSPQACAAEPDCLWDRDRRRRAAGAHAGAPRRSRRARRRNRAHDLTQWAAAESAAGRRRRPERVDLLRPVRRTRRYRRDAACIP